MARRCLEENPFHRIKEGTVTAKHSFKVRFWKARKLSGWSSGTYGLPWWHQRSNKQLEDISNGKCLLKCGGRGFCVASHFQQQVGLTESLCSQTATIVTVTDGRVFFALCKARALSLPRSDYMLRSPFQHVEAVVSHTVTLAQEPTYTPISPGRSQRLASGLIHILRREAGSESVCGSSNPKSARYYILPFLKSKENYILGTSESENVIFTI